MIKHEKKYFFHGGFQTTLLSFIWGHKYQHVAWWHLCNTITTNIYLAILYFVYFKCHGHFMREDYGFCVITRYWDDSQLLIVKISKFWLNLQNWMTWFFRDTNSRRKNIFEKYLVNDLKISGELHQAEQADGDKKVKKQQLLSLCTTRWNEVMMKGFYRSMMSQIPGLARLHQWQCNHIAMFWQWWH